MLRFENIWVADGAADLLVGQRAQRHGEELVVAQVVVGDRRGGRSRAPGVEAV